MRTEASLKKQDVSSQPSLQVLTYARVYSLPLGVENGLERPMAPPSPVNFFSQRVISPNVLKW